MRRRGWVVLVLGLAVLWFLLLGCSDDWDGMDRSSWQTPAATSTVSVYVPPVRLPPAWGGK